MKIKLVLCCVAVAFGSLFGCRPEPDTTMEVITPVASSSRITVTRIGLINDPLAYNKRRGIYIITDTKTGNEYVGVSGIGISELGAHIAGKAFVGDER